VTVLLSLLHLCDSLFPLGGYAHSDGLEAATASGSVITADDLRSWMEATLEGTLGQAEGPAVALAWCAFTDRRLSALSALNEEVYALRPSSTARQASRAMGTRLLKTWLQVYPPHEEQPVRQLAGMSLTLPVAFGAICANANTTERDAVEAFLYTRLAATASCAMRLMAIGQHEAHMLLASLLARVPGATDGILQRRAAPSAFIPVLDIAAMRQQYVHSRLFRS
jgi:urease accessory protein